jgi:hypothetical protein
MFARQTSGTDVAILVYARPLRDAHGVIVGALATGSSQPPALIAAALDLFAPFLTRLVSRG